MSEAAGARAPHGRETDSGLPLRPVYGPADAPAGDYAESLGDPGTYPFTRGRRPAGADGGWIQRELSGEGDPGRSNDQFRYLIAHGATGLDVIGDTPTMAWMDPDHPVAAIHTAAADSAVKVLVVQGAGRSFCAGYDFSGGFRHWDSQISTEGRWDPGKDFVFAAFAQFAPTQKFMSMWRCPKPVIAQVHGWCVGGGSDTALCADLVHDHGNLFTAYHAASKPPVPPSTG